MDVPGVVEEKAQGKLQGLNIAHIDYPKPVYAGMVGQFQLLAHAGQGVGVYPFVIAGPANIIEMIIQAIAALAFIIVQAGDFPNISPVVVAEHYQDVFGYFCPLLVVILYLLVHRPELGNVFCGLAVDLF